MLTDGKLKKKLSYLSQNDRASVV